MCRRRSRRVGGLAARMHACWGGWVGGCEWAGGGLWSWRWHTQETGTERCKAGGLYLCVCHVLGLMAVAVPPLSAQRQQQLEQQQQQLRQEKQQQEQQGAGGEAAPTPQLHIRLPGTHCDQGWCAVCRVLLPPDAPTDDKVAALAALAAGTLAGSPQLLGFAGMPDVDDALRSAERLLSEEPIMAGTEYEVRRLCRCAFCFTCCLPAGVFAAVCIRRFALGGLFGA